MCSFFSLTSVVKLEGAELIMCRFLQIISFGDTLFIDKVESIPSLSPSVEIQIIGGKLS